MLTALDLTTMRRFYKSIEDAYSYANRTLLNMLLRDQQLLPRLRSLKRFFFMSQSFFVTHLLDQAQGELRKSSKSASVLKLQSLLDLALNTDLHGEDTMFREDVKVKMATNGLYDWLLKIINEKGTIGGEVGEGGITDSAHGVEGRKNNKDEKPLMGEFLRLISWCFRLLTIVFFSFSNRCTDARLSSQVPAVPRDFAEDYPAIPAVVPVPASSQTCRTDTFVHVDRPKDDSLESQRTTPPRVREVEVEGVLVEIQDVGFRPTDLGVRHF